MNESRQTPVVMMLALAVFALAGASSGADIWDDRPADGKIVSYAVTGGLSEGYKVKRSEK